MLKVYDKQCDQCLFTNNRVVSARRYQQIVKDCIQKQSFFVCHKASINEETICCKGYFDKLGSYSQLIRIAERLNAVQFIEQPAPAHKR